MFQFNIRVLIVSLGGFNTGMSNRLNLGKHPVPEDYDGSNFDKLFKMMMGGGFVPDGDKNKAAQVLYEVIMGEGVGKGREAERFLPLGRDD